MTGTAFDITYFSSAGARFKTDATTSLHELAAAIRSQQADAKDLLPWLKLARFGSKITAKGSLRHDANVLTVSGVEGDYDGELIDVDQAVETLEKAGVKALVYTSPSHQPDKPRWRVLCPFSKPMYPQGRENMMRRLNGVFNGQLSDESFTLSQSYYYGHLYECAEYRVEVIDGACIDDCDELDRSARGKSGTHQRTDGNGQWQGERADIDELIRRIISGESLHVSVARIAGSYAARDFPLKACIEVIGIAFTKADTDRYDGRWRECERTVRDIYAKEAKSREAPPTPPAAPFAWMGLSLDGAPVPDPAYTVHGRIPANQVTLFTGHGGTGKSTIGLQLACGHVLTGGHWLGSVPNPGAAWFIDAEDPKDIIHWRLDRILRTYNLTFADLISGGLKVAALSGEDTILAHQDRRTGLILPTPLYQTLLEEASDTKPVQIVIASLANVFAGNENDRTQVQQFINLLKRFTLRTGGSLVLIAHPSKSALADGNGFSGSTAWFNATRAQINLEAADETGLRKLSFPKNQYGTETQPLTLRWREGVFVPEGTGEAAYDRAAREQRADAAFLDGLRAAMTQGRNLSHKSQSRSSYAPKILAGNGVSEHDLATAMERLFASGKIKVVHYGSPSRGWERIEPQP